PFPYTTLFRSTDRVAQAAHPCSRSADVEERGQGTGDLQPGTSQGKGHRAQDDASVGTVTTVRHGAGQASEHIPLVRSSWRGAFGRRPGARGPGRWRPA